MATLTTKQLLGIGAVVAILLFTSLLFSTGTGLLGMPVDSVELGVASLSPNGAAGGAVIPASCGSPPSPHEGDMCEPPIVTVTPNPPCGACTGGGGTTVNGGGSATISWTAPPGAVSCSGTNFSTGGLLTGSAVVSPADTTTYIVTCNTPGDDGSASVTVTVLHPALSLVASPSRVRSGNSTTLTWSSAGVTPGSCSVTGPSFFASGENNSQVTAPIASQTTYTFACMTAGGPVSTQATVNVLPTFEPF